MDKVTQDVQELSESGKQADTLPAEAETAGEAGEKPGRARKGKSRGKGGSRSREEGNRDARAEAAGEDRKRGGREGKKEGRAKEGNRGPRGGGPERPPSGAPKGGRREGSEYALQTYFDRSSNQFHATCLEFPELQAVGNTRDEALEDLEDQLESEVRMLKKRGEAVPDALGLRTYPDRLNVAVSQSLYRRLDRLSRSERIDLDRLVVELLSTGIEKRYESAHAKPAQGQQSQHHQRSQGQRQSQQRGSQQGQGGNRGGNRRGKNYHATMDSQGSFLEYVRGLEKGGWKKR